MASFRELKKQREAKSGVAPRRNRLQADTKRGAPSSAALADKPVGDDCHTTAEAGHSETPQALDTAISRQNQPELSKVGSRLDENSDIEVDMAGDKGRGLFYRPQSKTDSSITRGTLLLRLKPDIWVPLSSRIASHCYRCLAPANKPAALGDKQGETKYDLFRCKGCRIARYCGESCQRADWPSHRSECRAYKRASSVNGSDVEPGTLVRMLARLAAAKSMDPKLWRRIESLHSYRSEQNKGGLTSEAEAAFATAAFLCSPPSSAGSTSDEKHQPEILHELGFESSRDLIDLVCKLNANSITVTASDLAPVGICLSVTAAMLNHSCHPNAAVVFPDGPSTSVESMAVVAIRDIAPGEEIVTSYIDVTDGFVARQAQLQRLYSFQCACKLCRRVSKASSVDAREARWCRMTKECTGWYARAQRRCTKCQKEHPYDEDEETKLDKAVREAEEALQRTNEEDHITTWQGVRRHVKSLSGSLPPSAYPLLSLLRAGQTALVTLASTALDTGMGERALDLFDEATRFAMLVVAGMNARGIMVEGHPARAIAVLTLAKLLLTDVYEAVASAPSSKAPAIHCETSVLDRPPALPPRGLQRVLTGKQILEQAIKELTIGFGRQDGGGQLTRLAKEMMRHLDDELKLFSAGARWQQ